MFFIFRNIRYVYVLGLIAASQSIGKENEMKYKCTICGHVYDEEKEGVKFADLPADWKCPICKQPKSKF